MTPQRRNDVPADRLSGLELCRLAGIGHTAFAELRKRPDFPKAQKHSFAAISFDRDEALAFALSWNAEQVQKYAHTPKRVKRYAAQLERLHALKATS